MWAQLIPLLAQIAWALIQRWISGEAKKAEYEAKIKKITAAYNAGVKEIAELKNTYAEQRVRIRDEMRKKWKEPSP